MSYPYNTGMPPLPNAKATPYPSYPNPMNSSMPMPVRPSHLGCQAGFVVQPSNVPNPNSSPYPPYPVQPLDSPWATGVNHGAYPSNAPAYPYSNQPNPSMVYPAQSGSAHLLYPSHGAQQTPHQSHGAQQTPHQSHGAQQTLHKSHGAQQTPHQFHGIQQTPHQSHGAQQTRLPGQNHMMPGHEQIHRGNPTVIPAPNFDAGVDAQVLRKAMKGFGTDEKALINVICRRSNGQRQAIRQTYKTMFGKDLMDDIRSETSGNFERVLIALMTPTVDFHAIELHNAMAGIGTDEEVLIEVLCSGSNSNIHAIKQAYGRIYGKNLESELKSETSFHFKRLLVSLCAANRDESGIINHDAAGRDAKALLEAGVNRAGTDESAFNMVLCQRNFAQIRLVAEVYQQYAGHNLATAIKKEFSGDIESGLLAILKYAINKADFFATLLHESMAGMGTNDNQLIRLIVTRSEVDLKDIKVAFQHKYGKSLRSWIEGDTSGDYKHALQALVGE